MGYSQYNFNDRSARTTTFMSKSFGETFKQREIHESMDPKKALIREARDSEANPLSIPIILGLDVTGSMGYIPHHLIKEGLPKLVSSLKERGIKSPAILFAAVGDSRCDKAPFQVGQFESGDSELDMWLTRTWPEGGGGGNGGESYGWAWWFAAKRCVTDAWEKRKQKGFIFTIGDDNCHSISSSEFSEVLGITNETMSVEEIYKQASEKWNVYHINMKGRGGSADFFRKFMGENLLEAVTETEIPELIAKTVRSHTNDDCIDCTPSATGDTTIPDFVHPKITL